MYLYHSLLTHGETVRNVISHADIELETCAVPGTDHGYNFSEGGDDALKIGLPDYNILRANWEIRYG